MSQNIRYLWPVTNGSAQEFIGSFLGFMNSLEYADASFWNAAKAVASRLEVIESSYYLKFISIP